MKILIQRKSDHCYLSSGNQWSKDRSSAQCFSNTVAALSQTRALRDPEVEIIIAFDKAPEIYDVHLSGSNYRPA